MGEYEEKKFNNRNFVINFLNDFDYIKEKYGIDENHELYTHFSRFERMGRPVNVARRDDSSTFENIRLIYGGDRDKAIEILRVYVMVKEKIVGHFLNMPGLERLYDEHFFEFEWDMHLRLDFESHDISFYRDHFIHQVRNLYEMFEFLRNEDFFDSFKRDFVCAENKISDYVSRGVDRAVNRAMGTNQYSSNDFPNIFRYLASSSDKFDNEADFLADFYTNYIIKAATALSALFHDIGYPIQHFQRLQKRIAIFMPSMHMFFGAQGGDFDQIYALISNSLLCRIVSRDELYRAVCVHDYEHGAVSAVAFLLTFYESGAIHSLSDEKRTAVELAAVAIYDHSLKFKGRGDKEETNYYRQIYSLNPLAYLLRVCDDIQEWDRTYFEVDSVYNIVFCNTCKRPFLRNECNPEEENDHKSKIKNKRHNEVGRKCSCGGEFFRPDEYVQRKIIDVENCHEVRVEFHKGRGLVPRYLKIDLDYDPWLLLRTCYVSSNYAKYRTKDLNRTKRHLDCQRFGGYKFTVLDFKMSPNPFFLKAEILDRFFKAVNKPDLICKVKYRDCTEEDVDNIKRCYEVVKNLRDTIKNKISDVMEGIQLVVAVIPGELDAEKLSENILKDKNKDIGDLIKNGLDNIQEEICSDNVKPHLKEFIRCVIEMEKNDTGNDMNKVLDDVLEHMFMTVSYYLILNGISRSYMEMNSFAPTICEIEGKLEVGDSRYDFWHKDIGKEEKKKTLFSEVIYGMHFALESTRRALGLNDDEETKVLTYDALSQYMKFFDFDRGMDGMVHICDAVLKCDDYYNYCKAEDIVYSTVERYCDIDVYSKSKDRENRLDYFSDLAFFYRLSRMTDSIIEEEEKIESEKKNTTA